MFKKQCSTRINGDDILPVITIELPPQDYAKKTEIANIFTNELSRVMKFPKEAIVVLFHELSPENISNGGTMLSEKFKNEQLK